MRIRQRLIAGTPGMVLAMTLTLLVGGPSAADSGSGAEETRYAFERGLFVTAERALNRGHTEAFERARETLADYPLAPYLDYRRLARNLGRAEPDAVREFLEHHGDTPLADRLYANYLRHLGEESEWDTLLEMVDDQRSMGVTQDCHRRQALLDRGEDDAALEDIESIWLHGHSRPSACDPALDAWRDADGLTSELAMQRFALAMDAGQTGLARYLRRYLDRDDEAWAERWLNLRERPRRVARADFDAGDHPQAGPMAEDAWKRWIRSDLDAALDAWQERAANGPATLDSDGRNAVAHALGLRLAVRYRDEAPEFLAGLDEEVFDAQLRQWQVRVALRAGDWETVRDAVRAMPRETREEAQWHYWFARAEEALGNADSARDHYERAATERNFHGFLAADRIGQPYRIGHRRADLDNGLRVRVRNQPAMLRMRELLRLDRHAEARREWQHAVARMDNDERVAAAHEFAEWGWYDRAIFTVARARQWDDVELRFPLAFDDLIVAGARDQGIDPAWAMAVARQESAFLHDVRSHAGALGIMQIMPATGRNIASAAGVQVNSDWDILEPANNARLGTYYLGRNQERFGGHGLLSTAAYNAGAHRVRQWLPEDGETLDADIWAELIPFSETRKYIRRVYAYRILYAVRLGQEPPSMASLLYPVTAESHLAEARQAHLREVHGGDDIALNRGYCGFPGGGAAPC
ncbi:transglycosylase SLT domain-containing protein [Thioalkalivibrio halophilus]|uniref:Lytic murein transglycosylase n=1 Tax=Thioalkalivibrio halophilus TaxID=252474 RepID=A0A1V3A2I5_9GAMM|nr:transglycosylase SLT domain-containing protein [Thioalkalivibrio halophilus]OOC11293.1 lytic murein transglycosylase [Thioalkalivibrio halophilus]